jgi:arsenite methyltransferase
MMRRWHVTLVLLSFVVAGAGLGAQQRSPQQQKGPDAYAALLEDPQRVARLQVDRVVQALGLKRGMTVADIGAGSGLFTRPIAAATAPGVVYAVEIDEPLLKILQKRVADAGLTNVTAVLGRPGEPGLPSPVDLIFICDALHHITQPAAYLKSLRPHLRPGGRVAIIDYTTNWPEGHESMQFTVAQLDGWMKDAGFSPQASHDWIQDAFFLVYR